MKRLTRALVVGWIALGVAGRADVARADEQNFVTPLNLSLQPNGEVPESIYAPPEAMAEENQVNAGGVNFRLDAIYSTDYIFRGIDRSETSGTEDSGNVQIDGQMRFELERMPDLILGVFTNINDADPIPRFQEIR